MILKVLGKKPLPFISISSQLISCPDNKSMDFITQKKMGIFNATPSVASLLIWSLLNLVYSGTKSSSFSTALQASLWSISSSLDNEFSSFSIWDNDLWSGCGNSSFTLSFPLIFARVLATWKYHNDYHKLVDLVEEKLLWTMKGL